MESEKSLATLKVGQSGVVSGYSGSGSLREKLLAIGITKGTHLEVIRVAPLGDPIQIKVRNDFSLSIRKKEAQIVMIAED